MVSTIINHDQIYLTSHMCLDLSPPHDACQLENNWGWMRMHTINSLHKSYSIMDPPTCGVCLGSFASQKFVLSRDATCASKNP